ncbi:hypothetical protein VpaJT1_43 [Vibrio phage VpaJT_1]|nr:hypothetical protein VpaJT1_43 [Vibrio phage VpaJT_1]
MMSPKAAARRRRIHLYWQDRLARVEAARTQSRAKLKECRV